MSIGFHVVIPARFQSTRLLGKVLMDLGGLTVIERVYRAAQQAHPDSITIATDHQGIFDAVVGFGADVMMTAATHASGTDRVAEVVASCGFAPQDIIVNVQGDEPLIDPSLIKQVATCLAQSDAPMATLCWPIEDETSFHNPNVVKVVRDRFNRALYFSRSAIPAHREDMTSYQNTFRHVGLYAYRAAFLLELVKMPVCELESMEALEQLRVLWAGYPITVNDACVRPLQDINTAEDLQVARRYVSSVS